MSTLELKEDVTVSVSNIGGISDSQVDLYPGVNVLVGRNATNRTSFLQSIMAAVGSENANLKGDADEGRVELRIGDETYTRTLERQDGEVVFSGSPLLEDPTLADHFAFLLENNEARRGIARGDDLRDLVMRPVDTAAIKARIEELTAEKSRIDDELEDVEDAKRRLPDLEERRDELQAEIEEKKAELEEKKAEIEDADAGVEESREEKADLDAALSELNDLRSQLETTRSRIESERASLESVREERESVRDELEGVSETPETEIERLDGEIDTLRERKRELESTVTQLQSLVQFNEEMLEGHNTELLQVLAEESEHHDHEGEDITAQLLPESGSETGVCWTCGTEVEREEIEETLDRLRSVAREKQQERSEVADELDDLQARRKELKNAVSERERLDDRLDRLDDEVQSREETIERLKEEREELQDEIGEQEATVEELEQESYSQVLDLHREANEIEFEIDRLGDDLDDVESDVADLEERIDREDDLREGREAVQDELEELRTRIDRLEEEAVEAFNEHMEAILDVLEYENLDRIWIERTTDRVRQGRQKVEKSVFDLHVVRTTEEGTAYEDTVDHLSESEREVTGLVFALAGYLVHDVYEEVPFMLLDSLEAIDADRIARLVDYFEEYAPYIVVALLPEDAQALDEDYRRVRSI